MQQLHRAMQPAWPAAVIDGQCWLACCQGSLRPVGSGWVVCSDHRVRQVRSEHDNRSRRCMHAQPQQGGACMHAYAAVVRQAPAQLTPCMQILQPGGCVALRWATGRPAGRSFVEQVAVSHCMGSCWASGAEWRTAPRRGATAHVALQPQLRAGPMAQLLAERSQGTISGGKRPQHVCARSVQVRQAAPACVRQVGSGQASGLSGPSMCAPGRFRSGQRPKRPQHVCARSVQVRQAT